jgi:nitrile hydratase
MTYKFKKGNRVRVKLEFPPGHIRTPLYVRGKEGVIEDIFGSFKNPESLAYGGDGLPLVPLYWVKFDLCHVWDHPSLKERLLIEIYEHWLTPA